ncbi:vWA domain-containing protein [Actinomyces provencensis]|uniref:vWA domain-containing protein n=1 Tax=Actinomyces provencensis TaxID=1720198 RepID=UPI00096A57C9|nr:vWA domain-containing protein [Actinomyces provencensis]
MAAASLMFVTSLGGVASAVGDTTDGGAGDDVVASEPSEATEDESTQAVEGDGDVEWEVTPTPQDSASEVSDEDSEASSGNLADEAGNEADDSADDQDLSTASEEVGGLAAITPFALGPETTVDAPYLYWKAVDGTGALIGGATFTLAGPRAGRGPSVSWGTERSVTDCTSAPCTGYDRDPDVGEFLVKYLTPSTSSNEVSTSSRYRVRVLSAPTGYTASTDWEDIPSTGNNNNTGNWNAGQGTNTHDFGDFTFNRTGYATIQVQVGGDRQGLTTVLGLAGVTLQLWNGNDNGPISQRSESWATCVSDATGLCAFEVPIAGTGGVGDNSFRPWVVQTSVPTGWFVNATLRTGSGTGGNSEATPYRFRLGANLAANRTYRSTVTGNNGFMLSSTNGTSATRNASGGVWQQSRNNPVLPAQCGLDMAIVLDLSGSVTSTDLANLKSAAATITNSLVGTQSRAALFSFSTGSPANNATANYPALTSVSTQTQANTFTSRWSSWTSDGGTNWDRALATVAQAAPTYDVVVVITDGNPTFYQAGEGPGDYTRLREMENAIFSANAVKAEGSRILAVGVGSGVTDATTASNLAAISGPTKYSSDAGNATTADYFQESSYANAAAAVRAMALGNCASSVSVTKMIVPNTTSNEDVTGAVTAPAGWQFTASATSPVTISDSVKATTNDGTGTVNFPITLPGTQSSATVTLAETQQSGYELVTQNGARAVCKRLDNGAAVTVTNDSSIPTGFSVDVPSSTGVSCTVYNRAPDEQASITLEKQWVINGADPVPDGQQNAEFQAIPLISDPGASSSAPLTQIGWGVERTGYAAGDIVTVGETYGKTDSNLQCELVSATITNVNGQDVDVPLSDPDANGSRTGSLPYSALPAGRSTVTFTNVVKCTTELVLRKRVADYGVEPNLWTLTAIAPDGALAGPTGQSNSLSPSSPAPDGGADPSGEITPGVTYQLAESGGDPRYVQTDERTIPLINRQSTGTMTCERVNPTTGAIISDFIDGIEGGVTVPMGYVVRCTANNETASLTLLKHVEGDASFEADDWNLTATPAPGVDGLESTTVAGAETAEGTASTFRVRPGHTYTLAEVLADAGTSLAYQQLGLERWDASENEWETVGSADIMLGNSESATYRFVNAAVPSVSLPLTGGLGTDTFLLVGGGLLALAGIGGWLHRRRSLRAHAS